MTGNRQPLTEEEAEFLIRLIHAPKRTVYCHCCVTEHLDWILLVDGGACHECGAQLSLLRPFEPVPSMAHVAFLVNFHEYPAKLPLPGL